VLDRVNLLAAQIQYRAKHFDAATAGFDKIGHSDSTLASLATFNAALSWLQKGDEARFMADAEEFGKKTKDEKSRADLRLEAGLMEAAKGDPRATDSLRNFLREFPAAHLMSCSRWAWRRSPALPIVAQLLQMGRAETAQALLWLCHKLLSAAHYAKRE